MIIQLNDELRNANHIEYNRNSPNNNYYCSNSFGRYYSNVKINELEELYFPSDSILNTSDINVINKRFCAVVMHSINLSLHSSGLGDGTTTESRCAWVINKILCEEFKLFFRGFKNFKIFNIIYSPLFQKIFKPYYVRRGCSYRQDGTMMTDCSKPNKSVWNTTVQLSTPTNYSSSCVSNGVFCIHCQICDDVRYVFINVVQDLGNYELLSPIMVSFNSEKFLNFCKDYKASLEKYPELKNLNVNFGNYQEDFMI